MIKKSVFEQDIINGMQQQLRKQASTDQPDLVKAGECLHAAMEILEQAGLQSRADQVLSVLRKIAISDPTKYVQRIPTVQKLMEAGLTAADLQQFGKGDDGAKVKMNVVLRKMGLDEHEIAQFIGKHNVVSDHEIETYERFNSWMKDPLQLDSGPALPGQSVEMKSLPMLPEYTDERPSGGELAFTSLAKTKKDKHVKGLTPDKMIANLLHHGTVFNMADDGLDISSANFDPEIVEALGINNADDLSVDDILNIDMEQPETFEQEWKAWKEMQGTPVSDEPPATVRAIPTPKPPTNNVELLDLDKKNILDVEPDGFDSDIGLEDITDADDDILDVSDQETLEDFEDEVSAPNK